MSDRENLRGPSRWSGWMAAAGSAVFAALLVALLASPATAQDVTLSSSAVEVDLSGRVQLQAATSSCSDFVTGAGGPGSTTACTQDVPGLDLFMRRVRLSAEVTINDFITAKVEPDYEDVNGVVLRDAYGQLNFSPALNLRFGQYKKPFDGFQLTSSTRILTIERDLDIPGVPGPVALSYDELTTRGHMASYDIGVMAFGRVEGTGFQWWAGAFNGQASDEDGDQNGEKQLVGRARYSFDVDGTPLSVAGALAATDFPFQGPQGQLLGEHYTNAELFAELGDFDGGPHVQAGLLLGDNPLRAADNSVLTNPGQQEFATLRSWQVIGTYRFPVGGVEHVSAVEPVLRITRADPNTDVDDDEVTGITPGIQLFFSGRNKIALNWDLVSFAREGLDSESSFKAQFQAYF